MHRGAALSHSGSTRLFIIAGVGVARWHLENLLGTASMVDDTAAPV
ncbi:hypothetical protein CGLO_06443 [Colletotrichum gloeosporioides Cg-14]|uniref:Uncharacterized protein n=1 Tax=Colletotrichum gloeosporioides (strain Cg-14) TaxID=1237896 RepID=T0KP43_COLGC|nr:hypothetical protein CGLO_06443 [Colletotrichum gloeosporioides Cg-14]